MYDGLYPEASDAALEAQIRRPPDAAPSVPWFRGFWSAAGKALPRAGAEMGRTMTALQTPEAVGALDAPTMFSAPGKTPKPQLADELRQQDAAIRDAIKEMTPDPETTGAASMIVHDVGRFVGKATGYSLLGGTPAAILGTGLDEGYNEAARRMDEGIDQATATKLGVVKGVASAAAVALPVAGKTVGQTLLLAGAGGPGTYIAEQLTARKILEGAGYDEQASQIDPFDPLGLGVSFFSSLLFGAGVHGARRLQARSDARAADTRMLEASRPPGERTAVAEGVERAYTREQVDAAHVTELVAHREAQALHRPEEIRAAAFHARALDRATEQLAAGQRVSVADVVTTIFPDAPTARAVLDEIDALQAERAELLPVAGERAEAGEVARMRDELGQLQEQRPAEGAQAERELAKDIQAQERVSYKAALAEAKKQLGDRLADFDGRVQRLEQAIERNAQAQRAEERISGIDQRLGELERHAPEVRLSKFQRAMSDAVQELEHTLPKQPARADNRADAAAETSPSRSGSVGASVRPEAERGGEGQAAASGGRAGGAPLARDPEAISPPKAVETPSADYLARESARLVETDPDLMVMMEGMDAPVRAADLLAEVQAMAKQEAADAPLLKVAAECALSGG